jgi:hypothetical protein
VGRDLEIKHPSEIPQHLTNLDNAQERWQPHAYCFQTASGSFLKARFNSDHPEDLITIGDFFIPGRTVEGKAQGLEATATKLNMLQLFTTLVSMTGAIEKFS